MRYFQCPKCEASLGLSIEGATDEPEFKASCQRCGWRGKVKDLVVIVFNEDKDEAEPKERGE